MSVDEDITRLLKNGDADSLARVFEHTYLELRRIARSRLAKDNSHTLTPTVLVHEVYEKWVGAHSLSLSDRRHFYACVARAMRMIVVDYARRANADKRRHENLTLNLDDGSDQIVGLDVDRSLEALAEINERAAELVSLRYFVGLTIEEVASTLEISVRTAHREWEKARAFLYARMREDGSGRR